MDELEKVSELRAAVNELAPAALAALLPVLGPVAYGLFSGATSQRWKNRAVDQIHSIEDRISAFEGWVSQEYVRSDEFGDLFAETMSNAARTASEEVRDFYASTVVAAAVAGPGSQTRARRVLRWIEALEPIHFHLLRAIGAAKDTGPGKPGYTSAAPIKYIRKLYAALPGVPKDADKPEELLEGLLGERLLLYDGQRGLNTHSATFGANEARSWITDKGWETLRYLWPEEFMQPRS